MQNKNLMLVAMVSVFTLTALPGFALTTEGEFNVNNQPPANLIEESSHLKLEDEATIQTVAPRSDIQSTVSLGFTQPQTMRIQGNGISTLHSFAQPAPLLSAQFTGFPKRKTARLGWYASVGYSYSESERSATNALSSLHMFPLSAGVVYRYQTKDTQKWIPQLALGPQGVTYFQRGSDLLSYSGLKMGAQGALSLAYQLGSAQEVVLQYERWLDFSAGNIDLNANTLQIGLSLNL